MWYRVLLVSRVYPGSCQATRILRHKEATHAAYTQLRLAPTPVPARLHRPHLRHLPHHRHRLVPFVPPPVRHGTDPVRRRRPCRPPQPIPSLLQQRRLVDRRPLRGAGTPAVRTFYPVGTIEAGVDDTLCRKRALDDLRHRNAPRPPISSRQRPHVSWGHNWVILSLLIPDPPWSPTKVWALPVGVRLYRNRQGLTKGKKGQAKAKTEGKPKKKCPSGPNHRTRPELAVELIRQFAHRFPGRNVVVSGDSAYGGKSVLQHLPPDRRPDQPGRLQRGTVRAVRRRHGPSRKGRRCKKGDPPAGHGRVGGRRDEALGGVGVRSVRPTRDAPGQIDAGVVLQLRRARTGCW